MANWIITVTPMRFALVGIHFDYKILFLKKVTSRS